MGYKLTTEDHNLVAIMSRDFVVERLSSASIAETKSERPRWLMIYISRLYHRGTEKLIPQCYGYLIWGRGNRIRKKNQRYSSTIKCATLLSFELKIKAKQIYQLSTHFIAYPRVNCLASQSHNKTIVTTTLATTNKPQQCTEVRLKPNKHSTCATAGGPEFQSHTEFVLKAVTALVFVL